MTIADTPENGPAAQGYARTMRVIFVLGGASIVSVVLGVVKMKVAALILGPVGIGIIALLQNAVGVAATLGDAGMRQSGAREISRELVTKQPERVQRVVLTLCWMGLTFGLVSSGLFFLLRDVIADHLLARPDLANDLGWSTAAVAATVIAAALTAMLNGHHRVREITWVTIYSALLSCLISVAAIWLWGRAAIALFVVSAPLLLMLVSLWYVARLGVLPRPTWPSKTHAALSAKLLKLGVFVMLSAIVLSISELAVRLAIQRTTGLFELGLFSAAWTIGVYYLNFLMIATSTEFFPRLSARFDHGGDRNVAINLQIQALCFVAAPVVIILSAFCPWILRIMYSTQFLQATELVRLMIIGDVLRLSVYPMGFVLIAASRGRSFLVLKLMEGGLFVGFAVALLPSMGLKGVGFAHIGTFTILFVSYCAMLRGGLGFRLSLASAAVIATLLAVPVCLAILANVAEMGAALLGTGFLLLWAAGALWAWMKHRLPTGT
jgi:O-antigen/teichoic acid export membrane protein